MQRRTVIRVAITAALLLAAWSILSGRFDLLHLGSGVLVAVGVAINFTGWDDRTRFHPVRFLLFIPWLGVQVIRSNLRVARLVLSPGMPISPTFVSTSPQVRGDRALTTLGASVTLTPGTLTVDVGQEEIFVHALDSNSATDIEQGVMAQRVGPIFEEVGR